MSVLELFCDVDDFRQVFEPQWQQSLLQQDTMKRVRQARLSTSEIMTIVIHFQGAISRFQNVPYRVGAGSMASSYIWSSMTELTS